MVRQLASTLLNDLPTSYSSDPGQSLLTCRAISVSVAVLASVVTGRRRQLSKSLQDAGLVSNERPDCNACLRGRL